MPTVQELMVARLNRVTFANSFSLDSLAFGKLIIVSGIRGFPLGAQCLLSKPSFPEEHYPSVTLPWSSLLCSAIPQHCKRWSFIRPSLALNQSLGGQIFISAFFVVVVVSLGGYETFNSQYPECCVDGKLISPERTEAERNLASHCEKQSANHKPAYDQVCVMAVVGDPPLGTSPCCHQALWRLAGCQWPWCCHGCQ